jgi:hypothetical protein
MACVEDRFEEAEDPRPAVDDDDRLRRTHADA